MNIKKPELTNIYGDPQIGEGTEIGAFVEIGKEVIIGKNCKIGAFSFIPEGVVIGDNVFIAPRVTFCNDKYPPSHGEWRNLKKTIIEDDVVIGAGAIIGPNLRLGYKSFVGMGAIVTRDVPPFTTVFGNPAK